MQRSPEPLRIGHPLHPAATLSPLFNNSMHRLFSLQNFGTGQGSAHPQRPLSPLTFVEPSHDRNEDAFTARRRPVRAYRITTASTPSTPSTHTTSAPVITVTWLAATLALLQRHLRRRRPTRASPERKTRERVGRAAERRQQQRARCCRHRK